jgi:hypothetical protein
MPGRNSAPVKRDVIKGWTAGAVRRHGNWLYSIDAPRLDGVGISLTLTMRDTPASSAEFIEARQALLARLYRAGATRVHWVVEWQKRGTPHMHLAVYYPEGADPEAVASRAIYGWVAIASDWHAGVGGQDWNTIDGPLGWLQYLSKHAARGVRHYQRTGHPEGWNTTGRLWGHTGAWPTDEPMRFELSTAAYHRFRRLVRSWRVADARGAHQAALEAVRGAEATQWHGEAVSRERQVRRRITYARGMLTCSNRKLSPVRGVSDWLPEDVALQLVALIESEGNIVLQRSE